MNDPIQLIEEPVEARIISHLSSSPLGDGGESLAENLPFRSS